MASYDPMAHFPISNCQQILFYTLKSILIVKIVVKSDIVPVIAMKHATVTQHRQCCMSSIIHVIFYDFFHLTERLN